MSFDLLKTAKYVEGLNNAQFRVLFYLLEAANNRTYECFPSMKEIASFTRMSERTVQRHVSDLADMGLFERVEQRRKDGSRAVNLYRFKLSGTVQIGNQKPVDVQPAKNDGLLDDQPASSDGGPPSPLTGHISGILSPESPPLPSGEAPPRDLLGDIDEEATSLVTSRPTIMQHVADGWTALTTDFPRIPSVRVWNDSRKRAIARRAEEVVRASGGALDAYQVWDMVFSAIRNDAWLRGDGEAGRGHDRAFVVEIDHVLRTGGNPNFLRILEKATTNEQSNRVTSDPRTGRRLGPAEQSAHAALALIRAARERRT